MKKVILRYGAYSAATICALSLIGWLEGDDLDYGNQEIIGYASIILSLLFVYFGIRHYRDRENRGMLSFREGLTVGLLISLIAALAFGILDQIYVNFINPDFLDKYYAHSLGELETTLPPEEFKLKAAEIESQKTLIAHPAIGFLLMFFIVFVIGFIISLLSSLILQRK